MPRKMQILGKFPSATDEQIATAVDAYLDENPVQAGATAEQAAQIQANKEAIEQLQQSGEDSTQSAVQSDFEQNDETAADYIKNRPFYDTQVWKTNRKSDTFDYSEAAENIYGPWGQPGVWLESVPSYGNGGYGFNNNWPVDCTFCVEFDGVKYEPEVAVLREGTEWFYIGNPYLAFEDGEDNGLPYAIIQDQTYDSTGNLIVGDTGVHTVALYELESGSLKQLDEKFIPDSIARITDIPDSTQTVSGGFVAQDTAPEDTSLLWIDTSDNSGGELVQLPDNAAVYYKVTASSEMATLDFESSAVGELQEG